METELLEKISLLMMRKNQSIKRLYGTYNTEMKLSSAACLFILKNREGGCSAKELRDNVCYDKAFISRTLSELQSEGYIVRNPDDYDKQRGFRYMLSEKGVRFTEELRSHYSDLREASERNISKEDLAIFFRVSQQLIENIGNLAEEREKKKEETSTDA